MKNRTSGFTILELALAMAFISFLLLAIGLITVQVSRIYEKGVTIKMVNSNGRELIDEFSRTILASRYDKATDSGGDHFEYTYTGQTYGEVEINGEDKDVPLFGAFCTGNYSYIWNTGYAINLPDTDEDKEKKARLIVEKDGTEAVIREPGDFRLLRINDASHEVCVNYAKDNKLSEKDESMHLHGNTFRVKTDPSSNLVELLSGSDSDLVLYDLTFYEPALDVGTGDALFSASFILGTTKGGVDITTSGDYCKSSPDNLNTDFTYCSVNKFNFAARATGGIMI